MRAAKERPPHRGEGSMRLFFMQRHLRNRTLESLKVLAMLPVGDV
jgi:hypothetical protein